MDPSDCGVEFDVIFAENLVNALGKHFGTALDAGPVLSNCEDLILEELFKDR